MLSRWYSVVFPLLPEEKHVVDLGDSPDGLNEDERAQIEAIQAKARSNKQTTFVRFASVH